MDILKSRLHTTVKPSRKRLTSLYQVVIAQWLARWLATREVPGSNPSKRDNLLISD